MKTSFLKVLLCTLCITQLQADDSQYYQGQQQYYQGQQQQQYYQGQQQQQNDACCEEQCDPCCNTCCGTLVNSLLYSRVHAGYSTGDFIGIEDDYAEIGIFAPLYLCDDTNFFLDATGYRFNNSHLASSIGLGFRKRLCNCDVLGVNVYWDALDAKCDKNFNRVGVGLEWLGRCWEARANGYFNVGKKFTHCHCRVFDDYIGPYFATCNSTQYAIENGFDAEFGIPYCIPCSNLKLFAGVGPYYYTAKNEKNFWGGMARFEIDWNQIITLRVRTSYDNVYKSQTQGQIFVTLPFEVFCNGFCGLCDDALLRPVYRNGIIFTKECCSYDWNW